MARADASCTETSPEGKGRSLVRFIFLSLSTSSTWFHVDALLAQSAVPKEAPSIVGSERVRGSPALRKPQEVVKTTRLLRRALLSSAYIFGLEGGDGEEEVEGEEEEKGRLQVSSGFRGR